MAEGEEVTVSMDTEGSEVQVARTTGTTIEGK
jgi:hypothetical protein